MRRRLLLACKHCACVDRTCSVSVKSPSVATPPVTSTEKSDLVSAPPAAFTTFSENVNCAVIAALFKAIVNVGVTLSCNDAVFGDDAAACDAASTTLPATTSTVTVSPPLGVGDHATANT